MKPICRQRNPASSTSDNVQTSMPSSSSLPADGRVRAPSIAISVDLPDPERPTIETNSPSCRSRLAPCTASCRRSVPYRLVSDWADRSTLSPFRVDERMRRHSAHTPCREPSAEEAEKHGECDCNDRADLQHRQRRPGEWNTENTEVEAQRAGKHQQHGRAEAQSG